MELPTGISALSTPFVFLSNVIEGAAPKYEDESDAVTVVDSEMADTVAVFEYGPLIAKPFPSQVID